MMSNGVATELQKQFYNSWAVMVQDMRDYKTHGAWFKEAMHPILPVSDPMAQARGFTLPLPHSVARAARITEGNLQVPLVADTPKRIAASMPLNLKESMVA